MSLSTEIVDESNDAAGAEAPRRVYHWPGIVALCVVLAVIVGCFGFMYYDQASSHAEAQVRSEEARYENFLFQCVFNLSGESKIPSGTVIRPAGKPTFLYNEAAFFRVAGVGDVVFTGLQITKDYRVQKEQLTAFFANEAWGRGSGFSFWLATTPSGVNTVYDDNCTEFARYNNGLTAEDFKAR